MNRTALLLWTCLAAVAVLASFHVLHELVPHTAAVVLAGVVGLALGAAGYRRTSGDASAFGLAAAAGGGGLLGLFLLHLLPLLHG